MSIKFQGKTIAGNVGLVMDRRIYRAILQPDGKTYIVQEDLKIALNEIRFIHFDRSNKIANPIVKYGWVTPDEPGLYTKELVNWNNDDIVKNAIPSGGLLLVALTDIDVDKLRIAFPTHGNNPTTVSELINDLEFQTKNEIDTKLTNITDVVHEHDNMLINYNNRISNAKNIADNAFNNFVERDGKLIFTNNLGQEFAWTKPADDMLDDITYLPDSKEIKFTFKSGKEVTFPVSDLQVGIVNEIETLKNKNIEQDNRLEDIEDDITNHIIDENNPHKLTKDHLGLTNTLNFYPVVITITPEDWEDKIAIKLVAEVTPNSIIWVSSAVESLERYIEAEIIATQQGEGEITFKCVEVPTESISVNLVIGGVL